MTKDKGNKRKIEITDKRARMTDSEAMGNPQDLLDAMKADAASVLGEVDQAKTEFDSDALETSGRAAMIEEILKKSQQSMEQEEAKKQAGKAPADKPAEQPAEKQVEQAAEPTQPEQATDDLQVVEQPDQPAPEDAAAKYLELAQRREAEFQNFRKRAAKDKEDARRFAIEGLLYDLFPALDGLSQAAHTFKDKPAGEDPLLDGMRSTIKVLEEALRKHGIEKINEAGVAFDPNLHQPLAVEESADAEGEIVAEVYTEGFRYGDKILKPAMVKVVKPA